MSTSNTRQLAQMSGAMVDGDGTAVVVEDGLRPAGDERGNSEGSAKFRRLDKAISHPGSVKINVEGAFIVDEDSGGEQESPTEENGIHYENKDIRLPFHDKVVSHVAVDIGGSLAKLVYFTREPSPTDPGGRLNFIKFESDNIELCFNFIKKLQTRHQKLNGSRKSDLCVVATGGGAYKYFERMKELLGVEIVREEEMECLIIGLDFFITEIPREVFSYSDTDPMQFVDTSTRTVYPYLLVNIGSGVSVIKVSGPTQFLRVGGTSLGGGTLWGLLSLLTGARTFDEMLSFADKGDNTAVDMLVGDIYGTDYTKIGLKSTAIASTFGKVFKTKRLAEKSAEDGNGLMTHDPDPRSSSQEEEANHTANNNNNTSTPSNRFKPEDISRSLLYAISNNIGQIAYLQSEKHSINDIYFGGSFIRGHRQTMYTLSYAIKFWSQGQKRAFFLRHEGYLGAVGAFLKRQPKNWGRRNSFEGDGVGIQRWRSRESVQ
ncbi:MAG: hypothetical protein M1834_003496 [Cirrosporium novae-zelandiae]|nr:MAG: hypothetical protein M1834_003496 [Cirrosporium novae-zelandiae]